MSDADVRGERTTAVRSVRRRATLVRSVGGRCRVALPPRVRHTPLRDVAAPAQRISTVDPVARTPPAPPARTGIRATRVGGSAAVGAAIFAGIVALNTITLPALLAENLVPLALLTAGCMALVRWFRSGLSNTLRTGVIGKVREFGGGIYGSVAVATWLILEGRDIHGRCRSPRGPRSPRRSPLADEDTAELSLRPQRLEEFIGQPKVKEALRIAIDAARGPRSRWTTPSSTARPGSARRRSPCSWRASWA
jgi:hypothetical protein